MYSMQTVKLSVHTIEELERLNRRFFWGESNNVRKYHTIALEQICKPKEQGELRIERLRELNIAFLAKLWWRMIKNLD